MLAPHRYSVGQMVELVRHRLDGHAPLGLYTVVRQLPGPDHDREYRVKHQKDGHERVVLESRLRSGTPGVFS